MSDEIVLGYGVFSIGSVDIGLTRGGGQFTVTREYKEILADGDYGPVKGRIRKDKSVATLTIRALEIEASNLPAMYPATSLDTTTVSGTSTLEAKEDVEDADYNATVKFTGTTATGKNVVITLENAINLDPIDWSMIDKDEVIAELKFTGTYLDTARNTEPWSIDYVTVAAEE